MLNMTDGAWIVKSTMMRVDTTLDSTTGQDYASFNTTSGGVAGQDGAPEVFMETRIADALWRYVSPLIIVVGTVGNLFSLVVMSRPQLSSSVTSLILMVLALADTLVLLTGLLRQWIRVIADYDVRLRSLLGCRLHLFSVYWSTQFAAWCLASVTVERFVSVVFPHNSKSYMTRRSVSLGLVIIAIMLCGINSHFFRTYFLYHVYFEGETYHFCYFEYENPTTVYFINKVWPWLDYTFFFIIPFGIILFGNIGIIFRLLCARLVRGGTVKSPKLTSMTAILIVISVYFLTTVTPIEVYQVIQHRWVDNRDPHFKAKIQVFWAFSNILMYSNNACNFFLYIFTSPRFRKLFLGLFIKGMVRENTQLTQTMELSTRVAQVAPAH